MSGVYNRKLFRQNSSRDQLRSLGGIMSSSPELMQEALRTAYSAPSPSDLGPMPMPTAMPQPQQPTPPPVPFQPMGMGMDQGMAPQQAPMDQGMAPPMDQGMAPMDQGMAPMDQGMAPLGYDGGGIVSPVEADMGVLAAAGAGGFVPPMDLPPELLSRLQKYLPASPSTPAAPAGPSHGMGNYMPVDVGSQTISSSTATPAVTADAATAMADEAQKIADTSDTETPEQTGQRLVEAAATTMGEEPGTELQPTLASILAKMTGDLTGYEKNIDELNKGIIGAAIAAGTSARATQNIANGLLVGLQNSQKTEERRAQAAQALQLAAAQASGKKSGGSQNYDSPIDAYRSIYKSVMDKGVDEIVLPEGVTQEQFADEQARIALARMYTPDQLVGTQFEGLHQQFAAAASPAPAASGVPTLEEFLIAAKKANPSASDDDLTKYYEKKYGG